MNQFSLLKHNRFYPIFYTQFLGALNDNVFKNAIVILIAFTLADEMGANASILVIVATVGEVRLEEITLSQTGYWFGGAIPQWNIFLHPVAFVILFITALAEAIKQVLLNERLANKMGLAGYKRAQDSFDENQVIDKEMKIYQRLLQDKIGFALSA